MAGSHAATGSHCRGHRYRRRRAMVPSQCPAGLWRLRPGLCAMARRNRTEMPAGSIARTGAAIGAGCPSDYAHGPHSAISDPGIRSGLKPTAGKESRSIRRMSAGQIKPARADLHPGNGYARVVPCGVATRYLELCEHFPAPRVIGSVPFLG